ncbi:MAG: signal peptidase I [Bacteriovoracaceae bacterium]|nr:signal peptidase I [Bacteriovoracaceae bacterium]
MITIRNYIANKIVNNRGFILFALLLFSIRWSFADHYRVPSGSMLPTIQIGDHLFVNKMAYDFKFPFTDFVLKKTNRPKRGEIIVFKYPKDPSINYVKRLIGLPGDTIEVFNGFIKVNGKLTLINPHKKSKLAYQEKLGERVFQVQRDPLMFRKHHLKFIVPKGKYFFMGDNRDNSSDSRVWGFVPREYLKGKVTNVTVSIVLDGITPKVDLFRFGKRLI